MEKIFIQNTKGKNIATNVYRPQEKTKKLAILCPGNVDTKDYLHLVRLAERLSEHGYTVACFDPSGTWESEGDISDYLVSQYLLDIKSVFDFMLLESEYTHILLGGHSRGGQMALLYTAKDPRITEVLGIMPSLGPTEGSIREKWQKEGIKTSDRDIPGSTERKVFHIPYAHLLDKDQFNVLSDMKKIHIPVVLVAGELDDLVLPEDVKKLFVEANEPKKFILLKNIGHDYRLNPAEIESVNRQILEALQT